jgi:hypothetical protein
MADVAEGILFEEISGELKRQKVKRSKTRKL